MSSKEWPGREAHMTRWLPSTSINTSAGRPPHQPAAATEVTTQKALADQQRYASPKDDLGSVGRHIGVCLIAMTVPAPESQNLTWRRQLGGRAVLIAPVVPPKVKTAPINPVPPREASSVSSNVPSPVLVAIRPPRLWDCSLSPSTPLPSL